MMVRTEFRIILTVTCDNVADRDAVYSFLRQTYIDRRDGVGLPAGLTAAHMTKDEYAITDVRATEDMGSAV